MAKVKEDAVVEAVEEIIEQVDLEPVIQSLTRIRVQYAALGAAAGLAAGALGGVLFALRKARKEADQYITDSVIELTSEMREEYQAKMRALDARKKEPLGEMVKDLGYAPSDVEEPPEAEVVHIFDKDEPQPEPGWDYEAEAAKRGQVSHGYDPFVIHHDEFVTNTDEYEQVSFTYFSGDDVLVDERDHRVGNILVVDDIVGLQNLQRFGHGSEDPNVVYVRNPRLEVDYKISKSEGSYAQEILGVDDELQHSEPRRRRLFDDEYRH